MNLLKNSIDMANFVHRNQYDKAKKPYIFHPLRVMLNMETKFEQSIAVLHDVIEDYKGCIDTLFKIYHIPEEVINIIKILSRNEKEPYVDYIQRVCQNETARKIKLADLEDNMDLNRIPYIELTAKDFVRLKKYQEARYQILDYDLVGENMPE